jgi:hypothetical protein
LEASMPPQAARPVRLSISCTLQSFLVSYPLALISGSTCTLPAGRKLNSSQCPSEQLRVFKACHATVGATAPLGLVKLTTSFPWDTEAFHCPIQYLSFIEHLLYARACRKSPMYTSSF